MMFYIHFTTLHNTTQYHITPHVRSAPTSSYLITLIIYYNQIITIIEIYSYIYSIYNILC